MITAYLTRRTWLHAVPAGVKLALVAGFNIVLLPVQDGRVFVACLALTALVYASLGPAAFRRLAVLKSLLPVLAVIGFVHGLSGTWQDGLTAIARVFLMVMIADLVAMTTTMQALMDALAPLFSPLRLLGLSPKKLTLSVALVVRFVPVLLSNWQAREEAWRMRSGRRASVRLVAPFLAETLRMADHVGEALDARGFDAGPRRGAGPART